MTDEHARFYREIERAFGAMLSGEEPETPACPDCRKAVWEPEGGDGVACAACGFVVRIV